MGKPPLIVGLVKDRQARQALRSMNAEWLPVASRKQLLAPDLPRAPRLLVIQATKEDVDETCQVVRSLRSSRPLTDVLVWAPLTSAANVRALFHAGVKDVIVARSGAALVEQAGKILDDQQILPRIEDLAKRRSRHAKFESMLSRNDAMWDLFDLCARIAPAEATVLIAGETGTGKELLARAIHRRSGRQGRFVAANCASIPPELVNSELFGHDKGAFTGADRAKTGLVMHANQGTLFLDEIGDMPPEGQLSLLRMLQEKRVRPVGSLVETAVDVRVVAATNISLDQAVRDGKFREDLFYRLDVIRMSVPTLKERPDDILFLFGHFTKRLSKHYGLAPPTWTDGFLDALAAYHWPGNVRQLENFSERLVLSRPQHALTARDFAKLRNSRDAAAGPRGSVHHDPATPPVDVSLTLADNTDRLLNRMERRYLETALAQNEGRIADTARQAGISRRTLLRKLSRHGIDKRDFKHRSA